MTPDDTRIDWWISTRDAALFLVYLGIQSYFMASGGLKIPDAAIYILIIIYIVHVVLMKLNYMYEVALKKAVANMFEVKELKRLAEKEIGHFHYNLDARTPCIELLNKIRFKQEGEILVFEGAAAFGKGSKGQFMARQHNAVRYRMRPIQTIKIREERFATPMDKKLMAKARLKQAVIKILIKLQAYHIYEKIKRNKYCIIPVSKFVKSY